MITNYLEDFTNDKDSKYKDLAKEFHFNFDDFATASFIVELFEQCNDKNFVSEIVNALVSGLELKNKDKVMN